MAQVARVNDTIEGNFIGEHGGHYDPYGNPVHISGTITGTISSGSNSVFANGQPIARVGDTTDEHDICTDGTGVISVGSSSVYANGKAVARNGDALTPHTTGTGNITSGSSNVFVG